MGDDKQTFARTCCQPLRRGVSAHTVHSRASLTLAGDRSPLVSQPQSKRYEAANNAFMKCVPRAQCQRNGELKVATGITFYG